jgi:WD40 repeat protein
MRAFHLYKILFLFTIPLIVFGGLWLIFLGETGMPTISERAVLKGSDRHFLSVEFSPDSKLVAAGQQDGTLKIWETASAAEWHTIPGQNIPVYQFHVSILSLAFHPDGNILAWAANNPVVHLLDLKSKKELGTLEDPDSAVVMVRFSPNGQSLATVTAIKSGLVRLWDLETKTARIVFEEKKSKYREVGRQVPWIGALAYAPDGKTLAVGIFGAVVLVDVTQGVERGAIQGHQHLINSLVYSPDGKKLAGWGKGLTLWDSETGKELCNLNVKINGQIISPSFSPDGKLLAVGLDSGARFPSHVQIWDVEKQIELGHFICHQKPLAQLAWSPDGKTLATASHDATVKLWDVSTMLKSFSK